jgi:hypothetical protein
VSTGSNQLDIIYQDSAPNLHDVNWNNGWSITEIPTDYLYFGWPLAAVTADSSYPTRVEEFHVLDSGLGRHSLRANGNWGSTQSLYPVDMWGQPSANPFRESVNNVWDVALYYQGTNTNLMSRVYHEPTNTWSGPNNLGGNLRGSPAVSQTSGMVYVHGTDNRLYRTNNWGRSPGGGFTAIPESYPAFNIQ